jgi:hypothetical protein
MQFVNLFVGVKELFIKFLDTENSWNPPNSSWNVGQAAGTSTLLMNASIRCVPSGKFHFLRLFFINTAALHVYVL